MSCRGNQLAMRTFLVRALSFSAAAALVLNPALTPVVAADYRATAPVAADGQMNAQATNLVISKMAGCTTSPEPRRHSPDGALPQLTQQRRQRACKSRRCFSS